jgi:hypothetical protein
VDECPFRACIPGGFAALCLSLLQLGGGVNFDACVLVSFLCTLYDHKISS